MPNYLQLEQGRVFSFAERYLEQSIILNLWFEALPFGKILVLFQAWSHLAEIAFDILSGSLFSESAWESISVFLNSDLQNLKTFTSENVFVWGLILAADCEIVVHINSQ